MDEKTTPSRNAVCAFLLDAWTKIRGFAWKCWCKFTGDVPESDPRETIEFQPDALEIKNERLPLSIRLFIWCPVAVILFTIIWASFAKVDVIVLANGKLVTDQQTIVMKPLERTVIKKVNVRLGEIVQKDQILLTFDPTESTSEAARLQNEVSAYHAQFERLSAEFDYADYKPVDPDQFEQWQLAIFRQRQAYYSARIKYFDESLQQIAASYKSTQDSLAKQEERLNQVLKLEDMYSNLHTKNVTSLKELIEMQITRMEMEATVDQLRNQLLELNHRRGSTLAEENSFVQEWRNSLSEDLVTAERNLTAATKEFDKAQMLTEYIYLRAPCDAVVHEIASFSPGSAVREAEALITLVPLVGEIELEGRIRPQDIGRVKVGDKVRIKLDAYPFQKYGTLDGEVRNISEDTIQAPPSESDTQVENPSAAQATYYRARITIHGKLEKVRNFRFIPGMQAQGEIKTGQRRVIEYVLYPLIKAFDEAAREP
ncbi:MAG: HlyD family type I secretion periplasmic adaptor subunit [Victivallaceae bacterium]|nr:HlyD family type I secretion periplasmic adaptor subunit [Victivallaceae bacterium]